MVKGIPNRKFNVYVSQDQGHTWKKSKTASGWPITDDDTLGDHPREYGYDIAIDVDDIMIDVEIPEKMLKFLQKDINKRRRFDDNGVQGVSVKDSGAGKETE